MTISNETLHGLFALPEKVAIVTGSGSGIGKATAQLMGAVGAKVVVADLNFDAAETVAADIRASGGEAIAVEVDVSDETAVEAMTKAAVDAFGGIDVLVNNAAYRPKAPFLEMSVETWDKMHAVNTRGTFLCMR